MSTATLEQPSSTKPAATSEASAPWPDIDHIATDEGVEPWLVWLHATFPGYCDAPFAAHHEAFWRWLWAIEADVRPEAFIGIWPRGGAKSTSAELGAVALGARQRRRYGLYVSGTQDQADDHVGNVAAMLESPRVAVMHPQLADRLVGKYGNSKGWRRNRLRTAGDFTIDAIGLDTAARGVKLEDQRPDFLVIDDIDGQHDTADTTRRKIETLTRALIPAGAGNLAILAIQNLVIPNGVFARLADGRAEYLARRQVSGPIPALHAMQVTSVGGRTMLTGGEPTWVGQGLVKCQEMVDDMGLRAFMLECQHDVASVEGALWNREQIDRSRVRFHPRLVRVVTGVDPAATSGPDADDTGIITVAIGDDDHLYVLADRSCHLSPDGWARAAIRAHDDHWGDLIVAEQNNGGEMVEHTLRTVDPAIPVKRVVASRGKQIRAEPVAALYEQGRVHHVGAFTDLEDQLCTWTPESASSPDRLDALVWAVTELAVRAPGKRRGIVEVGAA